MNFLIGVYKLGDCYRKDKQLFVFVQVAIAVFVKELECLLGREALKKLFKANRKLVMDFKECLKAQFGGVV